MTSAPSCISVFIVRKTSDGPRYLLLRRCGKSLCGTWQGVTGGIDPKESASEAALRELHEETGLYPTAFYYADFVEIFYIPPSDLVVFSPTFVAFVEEEQVRLSPTEHDAYTWLSFEEAKSKLLWSQQKISLTHVHETFVLRKPHDILALPIPSKSTLLRCS